MRVIGKHRLVAFELLPRNVTGMMVANQDHPCIARLKMPLALSSASIDDLGSGFRLAEGIGARVHRIPEHVPDRVVHRQFPDDVMSRRLQNQRGQIRILAPKPQQHLPGAAQFHHFGEDQMHCLLHTTVGIDLDFAVGCPSETDWQSELKFPAACFLANRFQ